MSAQPTAQASEKPKKLPFPDNTVFLIPDDVDYDQRIIRAYLNDKYSIPADCREYVTGKFNFDLVTQVLGLRFVVCTRRPESEDAPLGNQHEYISVQRGTEVVQVQKEVPPARHMHEVHESAPVVMSDHVKQERGQLFKASKVDMRPLYDALCKAAAPRYRVTPQNFPDFMARMVWAG